MDAIDKFLIYSVANDIRCGERKVEQEIVTKEVEAKPEHYDYLERVSIPPFGSRIFISISSPKDLKRNLIKTDSAYIHIPAAEIEQPAGTGRFTTVEGLLDDVMSSIEGSSAFAPSHIVDACINNILELKSGRKPFKLIINDPISGSEVESWASDSYTGKVFVQQYERGWDDMTEYGLAPEGNLQATNEDALQGIVDLIKNSKKIAALTGAGISTESGIPAYRNIEGDGIWNIYNLEDEEINNFKSREESRINYWRMKYNLHKTIQAAKPCGAHIFFSFLHKLGKLERVVTQNIDGLHQVAGVPMEKIIEIHGNTNTSHCMTCGLEVKSEVIYKEMEEKALKVPICSCGGFMHPNTISYGVPLDAKLLQESRDIMKDCDLLFVVGSSLVVQPVNTLPGICVAKNTPVVMVNIGETKYDNYSTYLVQQKAGETFLKIMEMYQNE